MGGSAACRLARDFEGPCWHCAYITKGCPIKPVDRMVFMPRRCQVHRYSFRVAKATETALKKRKAMPDIGGTRF